MHFYLRDRSEHLSLDGFSGTGSDTVQLFEYEIFLWEEEEDGDGESEAPLHPVSAHLQGEVPDA